MLCIWGPPWSWSYGSLIYILVTIYAISAYQYSEFESRSGEVYLIQHYVKKFVSDLWQFTPGTPVSSINKTDRQDITEILFKVALNTITLTPESG